ncbi:PREDICTED: cadherin-related family member 3 [Chrysochloris asiatica]|uniref:Cadherin-related family member 3 n=1 Tax=Chrysochloris asiatica TaxID=185453 RepID=A0A9B0WIP6_CHRAS|nr:PREDICTED: cadherin-related family member 3 [Chrysochloris asiatica]
MYTIQEELSPGTVVANMIAEDPDDEGFTSRLLYSFTTVNKYFMINTLTGTIHVANRLDRDAHELRQNPKISLEVLVKDRPQGGQENRAQITFIVEDINDNPATCSRFTFSIMVPERAANGTLLLDLNKSCFDNDSEAPNNKFNFTTPSGVGSNSRFLQDPAGSGKIVLIGDLDYENPSNLAFGNKYSMIIQVQDVAPPYYKNDIYIYILTSPENEFPLIFDRPSYVFNVSEVSSAPDHLPNPEEKCVFSICVVCAFCHHLGLHVASGFPGVLDHHVGQSHPQILHLQAQEGQEISETIQMNSVFDGEAVDPGKISAKSFVLVGKMNIR